MKQLNCKYCKHVIIEDIDKFIETDKEKWVECPVCKGLIWKTEITK